MLAFIKYYELKERRAVVLVVSFIYMLNFIYVLSVDARQKAPHCWILYIGFCTFSILTEEEYSDKRKQIPCIDIQICHKQNNKQHFTV